MLPPGYAARPLDFVEVDGFLDGPDVDLAYAVVSAADIGVLGSAEDSREAIRANLTNPDAQRHEHRLVLTDAGAPVGLLVIEKDVATRTFFVDSYAAPTHGLRILGSLVAMGVSAAKGLRTDGEWNVEAGVFAQDEFYIEVLENAGFREVRRFWRMVIDLGPEHEGVPTAPAGVTRTVVATDDDRRLLHRIDEESFAEHFGFAPRPYEEFLSWFGGRRDARTDLWWLAWLDGQPVGLCVMDDSHVERGAGHVRTLGVLREARGRGIASWLLRLAFAQAAREGRRAVTLTVAQADGVKAAAPMAIPGAAPKAVAKVAPVVEDDEDEAPAPAVKAAKPAKAKPVVEEAEEVETAEPEIRKPAVKESAVPAKKSKLADIVSDWDDE